MIKRKIKNKYYNRIHYNKSFKLSIKNKQFIYLEFNKLYLINNKHDKIFRTVLSNKIDACKFINNIIHFKEKITSNDLLLYKTSFVTSEFKNKEADIVYKLKDKNIFILIEHQTKIDYTMPYRILAYQHEIIKSAINISNANTKNFDIPTVIPIVLYTGKQKWNAKNSLNSISINTYNKLPLSYYYLVDINDYSIDTLLKDDLLISKLMVLEKSRNNEELILSLKKILPKIKEEDKSFIINLINLILKEKIGRAKAKEYINKLKGGEEKMLACIEMIREEKRRDIVKRNNKKKSRKGRRQKRRKNRR